MREAQYRYAHLCDLVDFRLPLFLFRLLLSLTLVVLGLDLRLGICRHPFNPRLFHGRQPLHLRLSCSGFLMDRLEFALADIEVGWWV